MTTRIRILRGTRAGSTLDFDGEAIRLGRDPSADLRFDPQADLDVSARHALLFLRAGVWHVRDLGSTNGTWLNGQRIEGDAALESGDRIELGSQGPLIEVLLGARPPQGSTTQVLRAQLASKSRQMRVLATLAIVLIGVLAFAQLSSLQARRRGAQERAYLRAQIDSLLATSDDIIASLRGEMDSLARALQQSQETVRNTRSAVDRAASAGQTQDADELRGQLRAATQALARQQLAASLDFRAIEQANRAAVALVFVEADDGTVTTATAFAVRADATLLTVAHVLRGADGTRTPQRIAVQFSDSDQFFPAHILAMDETADLALVRAENIVGAVPVVSGLVGAEDALETGEPVAVIGYPMGGETAPGVIGRGVARPLVTAGVVTARSGAQVEVQGYGAAGASGSPIFDAQGRVAAVLIGGRRAGERGSIVGVPASAAARLLAQAR